MKDSNNENGARVPDVLSPEENDDPNGRWSTEERDQLLHREQEARLEAEVMRDANLALTQDLSLERILETLLDYLRKLVPFDSANVMLVAGDSYFVTSAIKGYENFLEDISLAKGNSYNPKTNALLGQICETKQSLLISDTKEEPRWQSVPGSEHVRNWIGVPLFAHDEIMGLYSLDKAQPGFFTAEHVRKAESLAAQAATAIQNAQLFRRVERYAAELEQLVAERRQAEEALRESEQLSRSVFEHIDEIIYMVSAGSEDPARGIVQFVSGRVEQIIGYKPDEFMNDPELWFNLLHPDDVPGVVDSTRKIFQEKRSLTRVYRVRHKHTGQYHWMEDLVVPRLDDAGTVAATFGVARDITVRKQAEEARREAEEKYRDIFENAGEGIFQSTPDGRFISANPAFACMHGFDSPEDLIRRWDDISRQIYADPARREEFKRLLEENGILRGFEHQVFRKDGSKIWISVNARAVRDEGGAIRYYEGTAQDINGRKRAEARSAAFATLARKLSGARTQLDAGRIITQTADDLFGWDSCDLNLYDADRDLIHHILSVDTIDGRQTDVTASISDREPTARGRLVIANGPELLLRKEPVQFDKDAIPFGDKTRPSASIMTVPVRHAAKVVGLLSVQSYTPHSYDMAALFDLEALADHCGAALNRIRAEGELREREERYRDLVENSRELICTHDLDGKILSANRAATQLLGYDPHEFIGKGNIREILAPEVRHQFDEYMARLYKDGATSGTMLVQTSSGERRVWEYYNSLRTEGVATPIVRGMARDVTDRKQAEAALKESEERFRQLSEAAFEAIILHDQGTILEVNQSFCRMYGYERAEMIGKSVLDLALPEFRELLLQKVRSGDAGLYEGLALRKDGTIFRAELAGKPIHYQGRTVRVAAIRDITEQKRNERRQAAQYAVTRVLAESATLAEATPQLLKVICESLRWKVGEFWRVGDSTNLLRCVETWHVPALDATAFIEASRQTELTPDAGLPGRVWQSGQPAWIPDVMTDPGFARAAIAGNLGLRGAVAFPILLGNDTLGVMLFFSRRIPEVDEDLLKMMSAIGSQIGQFTERKRAEEALKKSESDYRHLFNNANDAILIFESEGEIVLEANAAACDIYGYSRDELIGMSLKRLTKSVLVGESQIKELLDAGTFSNFESIHFNNKGEEIYFLINSSVIDYQDREAILSINHNITERKRTEEKVQSLARFPSENPNPVLRLGRDGMILHANSASRLLLQDWGCAVGDRAPLFWQQEASAALASQTNKTIDFVCGDITLSIFVAPIVEADYVNLYARDITERKHAEEALRQSEVYFRSLIEHAADTISTYDANGVRLYTSPSIERVLGYKPEEMIGRSGFELLHPDDRPFLSSLFAQAVQIPGTTVTKELRCQHKDGTWRTLESTGSNLLGNPEVGAIVLNSRDITERRRAEEALRESEERYRDLVENSQEFICTHDLDGLILSGNRAAVEVMGYDPKDYYKRNLRELLVPEVRDQFDDYLTRLRRDGVASGLMLVQTSSGERRVWEYHNTVRTEGVAAPIVRSMARDITERRRAEKAMSDLRRELEMTMNSMGEGVHRVDLKGNIVFENPAAAHMLGWEVAELLGKHSHSTMHHTRQDGTPYPTEECPIYATFRDGVSRHVADEVFWRRDGTSFPVEYMTAPMRNDRNEIVAAVVTFRDITERKQAEEIVRSSEQRLRNVIDGLGPETFVGLMTPDGTLIEANKPALAAAGLKPGDVLGKPFEQTYWWSYSEPVQQQLREAIERAAHGEASRYDVQARVAENQFIVIDFSLQPLRDETGKVVFLVPSANVITERKQAEAALRESEERYRELFENAKDAIYVHDLGGRYTSINRAAEKLSGFTREEILGKHFSNFVSPRDLKHVRVNLCRKLDEENETIYDVDLVTRTGQRVPVEVSSRLLYENGVAVGVQGVARDITDRKRAQEALRIYSQRLIQAQEAEREKIARELHDQIGQILTAVRINLQSIQRSCQTADCVPPLNESIGIVDEALGRVRELSIELRPSLLDDLGLTAALRWYVDRFAQRTGIIAEILNGFEEGGRLPRELETACFRIAQEALTNVARHAQAGSVSVQLERSRERMLLTIIDDGVGFDVDKLKKSASAATALGLRGMEERALAVGGYIKIDSGLERGTQIRATFPLKRK